MLICIAHYLCVLILAMDRGHWWEGRAKSCGWIVRFDLLEHTSTTADCLYFRLENELVKKICLYLSCFIR